MGLLDDAIREHLELKRRHGADEAEIRRQEQEALSPVRSPAAEAAPQPGPAPEPEPAAEAAPPEPPTPGEVAAVAPEVAEPPPAPRVQADPEPWLDEPDEVPAQEALDHPRHQPTTEFSPDEAAEATGETVPGVVQPDAEPGDDLLEETPDFLQETPEHDRLWFEQKPPRDFDF